MNTPSRRTFTHAAILLGAGLFALGATPLVAPLRAIERQLVKALALSVDPVDTLLDGDGSAEKPWTRRKASPAPAPPPPRLLNIDDDPEGYFSKSPLAPVDHAVIFSSLHEAGHRVIGIGHLMAWEDGEPLAMEALRKQIDRFDAAVLALPLARGAVPEPVAAPFLRWSIPTKDAQGPVSSLPQVNRIAVANAEQGGARSLAGFSILENEADPGDAVQALLARWDDRIVFSFPLAVEIAAEGLTPADVIVHVGKEIRIGKAGPVIPVDEFGRGKVPAGVEAIEAPAKRIVSEGAEGPKSKPLLTRDIRESQSEADRLWSDRLAGRVQALRSAPRYEPSVTLPRPEPILELLMVSLLVLAATLAAGVKGLPWRIVTSLAVAGFGAELLYLFASRQNAWLPPLAMLGPGLIALGLSFQKDSAATAAESREHGAAIATAQAPDPALLEQTEPPPPAHGESAPSVHEAAEIDPVETVTALGFPPEYAWSPPPEVSEAQPEPAPPAARKSARKAARKTATKTAAKKVAKKAAARKSTRKRSEDTPESGE